MMDVSIYQIDPEKDENVVIFTDYDLLKERQSSEEIDSSIYGKVFEGVLEAENLEEIYRVFNWDKPEGYAGRSMSVSDIIEVRDGKTGEREFYYCDSIGFRKVDFDPEKTSEMRKQTIRVVMCEPSRIARITDVGTDLESLQKAVGGFIETYYPFDEEVCIVCNDEGKLNGMSPCRAIFNEEQKIQDIVFGPFFICDCSTDEFKSLSTEQLEKYVKMFANPEHYFKVNGEIKAVPYVPSNEMNWAR